MQTDMLAKKIDTGKQKTVLNGISSVDGATYTYKEQLLHRDLNFAFKKF